MGRKPKSLVKKPEANQADVGSPLKRIEHGSRRDIAAEEFGVHRVVQHHEVQPFSEKKYALSVSHLFRVYRDATGSNRLLRIRPGGARARVSANESVPGTGTIVAVRRRFDTSGRNRMATHLHPVRIVDDQGAGAAVLVCELPISPAPNPCQKHG